MAEMADKFDRSLNWNEVPYEAGGTVAAAIVTHFEEV